MRRLLALFAIPAAAFAQLPQIDPNGVVNAASWSSPVSPGALAAVFGKNLASKQQSTAPPWPTTLAGTSVSINGIPAPLVFVSPGQINFQMPSAIANSEWFNIVSAQVVVTTSAGASAAVTFGVGSMPGLFTVDGSGCGQAAALNIRPDGSVSVNSPSNSAAPGDYVTLFGTGFGFSATQPPDGTPPAGPASLLTAPRLLLDETLTPSPAYAGLAPALAGVDQINFQAPNTTRNGCAVPVIASAGLGSPAVTIAVQSGGGQCTDPPVQSYGSISLNQFIATGPPGSETNPTAGFTAYFPASPGLKAPSAAIERVFAPKWVTNDSSAPAAIRAAIFMSPPRVCPVPGYTHLSAGVIRIQPPGGSPIDVTPLSVNPAVPENGVSYAQDLPVGALTPGIYTISSTPGSPVSLNTAIQVGSPIQLQTTFAPGAAISQGQPLTIRWTGGDAASLVRLTLTSTQSITSYARATDGSLTILPDCFTATSGNACTFGLPNSTAAQLSIAVIPANPQAIAVAGVTGPVQVSWAYNWAFTNLNLTP